MFDKKTIYDEDLRGKTVLIRADFNVPINQFGVITDDTRIRQALPTIEHIHSMGGKIILLSHLGRPEGPEDIKYSLAPVAIKLSDLLHLPVEFVNDCVGPDVQRAVKDLPKGGILLLENLRFHKEEEANDKAFAKELASLGDIFVQDGFGVIHRAHASTEAITKFIPSVAGLLLKKEVEIINNVMNNPQRPLSVIIGGAKISDKIDLINIFIEKADFIAIVGAMANTFLLAEGTGIGMSLAEPDCIKEAQKIIDKAHNKMRQKRFTFLLPVDVVVAKEADNTSTTRVVDINSHTWADINNYPKRPPKSSYTVAKNEKILDIGPITAGIISGALFMSATAIWNGTAGVTEIKGLAGAADPFAHGSISIANALSGEKAGYKNKPFTVVGGGDTVGFVESVKDLSEKLDHVSTGGGASLELMAGKKLPGLESLKNK